MLFKAIITAPCENHTKYYKHAVWENDRDVEVLKHVVHIVTSVTK